MLTILLLLTAIVSSVQLEHRLELSYFASIEAKFQMDNGDNMAQCSFSVNMDSLNQRNHCSNDNNSY
jgi:hypothetical protein